MRTANNARFLAYLEGTPQARELEEKAVEWSSAWLARPHDCSRLSSVGQRCRRRPEQFDTRPRCMGVSRSSTARTIHCRTAWLRPLGTVSNRSAKSNRDGCRLPVRVRPCENRSSCATGRIARNWMHSGKSRWNLMDTYMHGRISACDGDLRRRLLRPLPAPSDLDNVGKMHRVLNDLRISEGSRSWSTFQREL